jgi:hypothetical protein
MKRYLIYRKAVKALNENEDILITNKFTEKIAQDWIDSQKNQMFKPEQYYIKTIEI